MAGGWRKRELKVYNSMTRRAETFVSREPGKVGIYVCGITAYDLSHLGHARAAVSFDVLFRYLKYLEYDVTYVRNFTDVDDKIIRRANEIGEDAASLSRRYCDEYLVDMDSLQCLRPTMEPRVTEHMEQIKKLITKIIDNGFAYEAEGDVFFAVEKLPNYGQLSGQKLENMKAGGRVVVDPRKRHPADFALWKAVKAGEPSWDSPWGPGRPGWHIECSAMSEEYLTNKFDIHGGGLDLIFPHHENEIAQSYAACPESSISYWMHNGHVTNKNEKMSKSLGNFFTIREIARQYHPLALRYFLISAHYRSSLKYSVSNLDNASAEVFYIYQTLLDSQGTILQLKDAMKDVKAPSGKIVGVAADARKCIATLHEEFENKMSDDLDTPQLLSGAFKETLKFINSSWVAIKKKMQKQQQSLLLLALTELEEEVKLVMSTLGLLADCTYDEVLRQLKEKALIRAGLTENDVLRLIEERVVARKNKDFTKSDQVRAELTAKGIALMDEGSSTSWRPAAPPSAAEDQPAAAAPSDAKDQPAAPAPAAKDQPAAPAPAAVEQKEDAPAVV